MRHEFVLLSILACQAFAPMGARVRVRKGRKGASNQTQGNSIGQVKKSFSANEFVVYYPESSQDVCDVIMFAVGTAVSVDQYGNFSHSLVGKGYVVVIVDPQKGSLTKLDFEKSKAAFETAKSGLGDWISTCGSFEKWIMGGHSAGGGTAHAVISANPSLADAVFSFDPFDLGLNGRSAVVNKPALYWGFDFTSCSATKEKSAQMAYDLTDNERRVLVRVKKVGSSFNPTFFHCSLVDGGCFFCSRFFDTPPEFFVDLSNTVSQFITDAFARTWAPEVINIKTTVEVDMISG